MPDQTETPNATPPVHDDTFFVLRDCRELFQQRLAEIVQQAGVTSSTVLEAFTREIGEVHDELASSARQEGFEQTAGLTASRITLVGNDDLELEIRIGDIANHLKGNDRIDHWRAQLRYKTLLRRPKMTLGNNPVGFEPISLGLWVICKESGNSLEKNFALLDRIEELLQLRLPEVYADLNALLERNGVEPAQIQLIQRERGPTPYAGGDTAGTPVAGGAFANNALASLQLAMQQQSGTEDFLATEQVANRTAEPAGNFTANAVTLLMLNQLMERLRVLELQQSTGLADFSVGEFEGVISSDPSEPPPLHVLKSKDLDVPLGKPATIALDTLSLIFECLFATPELPNAVKVILSRLQIPLLKLAILDVSFFANAQHPARQLVNRIARAAIGLSPDVDHDHPVCVFLAQISDAVRVTLDANEGDLSPLLDQIDDFTTARDQSLQSNALAYLQLLQAHEAQEAAQLCAQNWLDKTLATRLEPAFEAFLATYWIRVMRNAYLDGGSSGTRWKENDATIQELLWSIRPKTSSADRKKLLALIPTLLKRINAELDQLQVSTEARTPFFDACFDLQTASLRPANKRPEIPDTAAPTPSLQAPTSAFQILEQSGKLVQYCGLPDASQFAKHSSSSPWKQGDWLYFHLPEGEQLCGCCCGQYAPFGTLLLFNPEWAFAVALAPSLLEQQLRDNQARIVSDSTLFDDAAERALAQMASR